MTFQYIYILEQGQTFLRLLDDEQDIVGQLNDAFLLINNLHPTEANLNAFQGNKTKNRSDYTVQFLTVF